MLFLASNIAVASIILSTAFFSSLGCGSLQLSKASVLSLCSEAMTQVACFARHTMAFSLIASAEALAEFDWNESKAKLSSSLLVLVALPMKVGFRFKVRLSCFTCDRVSLSLLLSLLAFLSAATAAQMAPESAGNCTNNPGQSFSGLWYIVSLFHPHKLRLPQSATSTKKFRSAPAASVLSPSSSFPTDPPATLLLKSKPQCFK
mmetsp:Transcript_17295/g.35143  ORF Transcript_17295/g.35143 Transcript_17295/m.35143 type:complete len:204 (-) Transcript_17295:1078-1689(-)